MLISRSTNDILTPGLSITMAIIYGQYDTGRLNRCPRLDCRSTKVARHDSGGLIWYLIHLRIHGYLCRTF